MKTTERQLRGINYLSIEPDGYSPGDDYPLIILLHGYPGDMEDLAWVAPGINEDGYVYYPNVNVVEEMADMMSSSRSFQMNVDVMNTAKSMMQRILTLGQQ